MVVFNVRDEVTQEVVLQNDPALFAFIQASIHQLVHDDVLNASSTRGGYSTDMDPLQRLTEKLCSMGLRVSPDAFSPKRRWIEQVWAHTVEQIKKMNETSKVRFQSDRWRYQKEARQYYSDPAKAFATELLQNSLDAMSAVSTRHDMKIQCELKDISLLSESWGMQRRIEVTFRDNGVGMNKTVIEQGLLSIGASMCTRTDVGKKRHLSESAGGFGLAKVLLYLGQTSFKVWTRMKDNFEWYVSADPFRQEQESCNINCSLDNRIHTHGTMVVITLDPWVMEMNEGRLQNIGDDFYTQHASENSSFSIATDYKKRFKQVWRRSNLPITLTLDGADVEMNAELGDFQTFIYMPFQGKARRFAALYSKDSGDGEKEFPPLQVMLQTLSNRIDPSHSYEHSPGYFLYLCDLIASRYSNTVLRKELQLSVLLFARDQDGEHFQCTDLLKATRDDLTKEAHSLVMDKVQEFIMDPYSVKPPAPRISWYNSSPIRCFSDWLQGGNASPERSQSRTPDWWRSASAVEANSYFQQRRWRETVNYSYAIFVDPKKKPEEVPVEFRDHANVDSTSLMWLELFGVFVCEVLDVFMTEIETRCKPKSFNIGFYIGKRDFVRPVLPGNPGSDTSKPTFLINKTYMLELLKKDVWTGFSLDAIVKSMTCLKTMALRELIFLLQGLQDAGDAFDSFQEYLFRLEEASLHNPWKWFKRYKEILEDRLMRDLQDGCSDSELTQLRKHVVAMQAPVTDDGFSRHALEHERARLEEEVAQMRARADNRDPCDEQEFMPNPAARLNKMNPFDIRFSQDSCKSTFRCGRLLEVTIQQLRDREIRADLNIPLINVFRWNGKWFSADNRRLWCYQQAKLVEVPVNIIEFREVWRNKLTTQNEGVSIRIRG